MVKIIKVTSADGWVVQVTRTSSGPNDPTVTTYFNVAIRLAEEAIVAAVRTSKIDGARGFTMRRLTREEVEYLGLRSGEVKPA
jgi:hypothetical protein